MKVFEALRLLQKMPDDFLELLGDIDDCFAHVMPEWSLNDWPAEYNEALGTWPEYSRWVGYPVRGPMRHASSPPVRDNPMWARRNLPLWSGEYGESRRRLLDHLASFFEMVDK